jgi:hypothetical protein
MANDVALTWHTFYVKNDTAPMWHVTWHLHGNWLGRGGGVAHKETCIPNECLSHKFQNFQEHEDVN